MTRVIVLGPGSLIPELRILADAPRGVPLVVVDRNHREMSLDEIMLASLGKHPMMPILTEPTP